MTLRALSPKVSAAGAAAPVMSKLDGLPCGAFGSITVLIFSLLPFPRSWGARGTFFSSGRKNCGAHCAPSLVWLGYFAVGLAGRRKGPRAAVADRLHGTRNRLVPNGAKNTPG